MLLFDASFFIPHNPLSGFLSENQYLLPGGHFLTTLYLYWLPIKKIFKHFI